MNEEEMNSDPPKAEGDTEQYVEALARAERSVLAARDELAVASDIATDTRQKSNLQMQITVLYRMATRLGGMGEDARNGGEQALWDERVKVEGQQPVTLLKPDA